MKCCSCNNLFIVDSFSDGRFHARCQNPECKSSLSRFGTTAGSEDYASRSLNKLIKKELGLKKNKSKRFLTAFNNLVWNTTDSNPQQIRSWLSDLMYG